MFKRIEKINNILTKIIIIILSFLLLLIFLVIFWQNINFFVLERSQQKPALVLSGYDVSSQQDLIPEKVMTVPASQAGLNDLSFIVSPDGAHFAYIIKDGDGERVALDGQEGHNYETISFLMFSADSQHFAYGAEEQGKDLVVLDGQAGDLYDWIFKPYFFTPQGNYFIYKARSDQGDMLVVNGAASEPYDYLYAPFVSDDGGMVVSYGRRNNNIWRTIIKLK